MRLENAAYQNLIDKDNPATFMFTLGNLVKSLSADKCYWCKLVCILKEYQTRKRIDHGHRVFGTVRLQKDYSRDMFV